MDGNQPKTPVVVCVALIYLLFVLVIPPWFVRDAYRGELEWFVQTLSEDNARWVAAAGESWYDYLFVKSGIHEGLWQIMMPTPDIYARGDVFSKLGSGWWFPYLNNRGEVFLLILHQALYRLAMITVWIPFLIIISVPAVLDGMMQWRIRKYTFSYQSPYAHWLGFRMVMATTGVAGIMLIAPVKIFHPYIVPIIMALYAVTLNVAAAHTQKKV